MKKLSIEEYSAAVQELINGAFDDSGRYDPASQEVTSIIVPIKYFSPHMKFAEDGEENFRRVFSPEIINLIKGFKNNEQYKSVMRAADCGIRHRLHILEGSSFSATDLALSSMIGKLSEKLDKYDFSKEEGLNVVNALANIRRDDFAERMADAIGVAYNREKKSRE